MKFHTILAAGLIAGFALPAAAETSFYIVQDVHTKRCQIVDQKPVSREMTMVGGDGVIYHTRVEAENALKTVKVCEHD